MPVENKRYQKSPDIVSRKIADEVILVPIRNNVGDLESIYTLNEVAARVWELVDGRRSFSQIKDFIVDEFDASLQDADNDLKYLLEELKKIRAVQEV